DYNTILEMFDRILNPDPMSYTSPELKSVFSKFKDLFEKHYEEQKELELLESFGCDIYQGYYFSKPLSKEELIKFIKRKI
ncbi:MAG: hypothetical protein ACPGUI_07920, partial [Halarcobacter sp.]